MVAHHLYLPLGHLGFGLGIHLEIQKKGSAQKETKYCNKESYTEKIYEHLKLKACSQGAFPLYYLFINYLINLI